MKTGLRKLTPREHLLCASVLVFALTMIEADMMLPDAARLRSAGHSAAASVLSFLPALVFVVSLLVLLPRTGNDSNQFIFRLAGRLPLLVRYAVVALFFYGLAKTIKAMG